MDTAQLSLLALLIGSLVGAGVTGLVLGAVIVRDRSRAAASSDVPAGVRDVLEAMEDAAVVVDGSATVRAASPPAAGFGLRVGEIVADDAIRDLVRTVRSSGMPASMTILLRRAATPTDQRHVAVRGTRLSSLLVLVVIRDITEQERVEQMRRDFVANTSHELKTPVGAVSLLAEAIESAAEDPEQVRVFARRLSAEAARLASLTSRVMSLSRLQSADDLAVTDDVAIDSVVASAIEAHATAADAAGVTLVRGGDRGLVVRGDQQILSEAVGNLIANAIAYSPRGSSVGIGISRVGSAVEIAVTDRGIGIAEDEQQRVFERFYRSDQGRSRRTGGTGLGLSIVKHAVQRHGGEVRLWSRPGRGSTFTVHLPLAPASEIPARPRRRALRSRVTPAETPRRSAP
jgi:two-component system sensor histidine kinase SenX3